MFLPTALLVVSWLAPFLWVYGRFFFITLVKLAVMFWPLLFTFELITLWSLAWYWEYLFIAIEEWWLFYAYFNSFNLLSSWTFLSYYSMRLWAFYVPLTWEYLEVPVADPLLVIPCPVPDLNLVNTFPEPIDELLLWDDFLPS